MRKLLSVSCLSAALLAAGPAAGFHGDGENPLGRGGFALPQGEWSDDAGVDGGFGYGINARLQIFPVISLYGGWEKYTFDTEAETIEASDTGLRGGAHVSVPLSALTGVSPFAFAGVVYNETSFKVEEVDGEFEADSEFGYEVGAGVAFPIAPTLSLTPSVRYRAHPAELPAGEAGTDDIDVSYLVFDIGLKLGL